MNRAAALNPALYWMGLALIGTVVVAGLIEPLLMLTRYVPLDSNEGWNALFGNIAIAGGDLYPRPGSFIVNNYPPLSFYIVGIAGRVMGDNIFAGRLIALVSMLIVAANVYGWLLATGATKQIASLGAGTLAALAVTYAHAYAGINDPQWLAHAIMTTGLLVLWRGNASARAIALGSILVLAGGWTKHLLIPIPIAVTWWLMRRSKSAFLTWLGWSAFLLAASGLLVGWLYGAQFFDSLRTAREYSPHQAFKATRWALFHLAPVIALSLFLVPYARGSERREFAVVYFLVSATVAVAAAGGIGVDINAFFDLMIAASMTAALAVEKCWNQRLPWRSVMLGPVAALLLGVFLGVQALALGPLVAREVRGIDELERETLTATRLIAVQGPGRTACESPELCYWAKSAFVFDFFNYGERLKLGKQPLTDCASLFDGTKFSLVQLDATDGRGSRQLPAACNDALRRHYRPVLTSSLGVILAPLRPPNAHF